MMVMMMNRAEAQRNRKDAQISINELRLEFDRVLKALKQGRTLTLTYRNKPLASIAPIEADAALRADDSIYRMYELAASIGGKVTNRDIDRLIYGV
jgi:antitoxin (DNA-binding transcriptional repressor) of toxin-antitoxin stability system